MGTPDTLRKGASELFQEFWQWRLQEFPEFATCVGSTLHNDKLESYAVAAFDRRRKTCEEFLKRSLKLLEAVNPEDQTTRDNLELFSEEMKNYIDGLAVSGYFFPINFLEGVHVEFERLVSYMKLETLEDYHMLISRYRAFPSQADEIILLMREGIRQNMVNHSVSMQGVLDQFEMLQKPCDKSAFYEPFLSISNIEGTEAEIKSVQEEAKAAIENSLLPAFKYLATFIKDEYLKCLRSDIAISSLPDGKEFYQKCLDFHLTVHMTPEEVHKVGLQEVERINQEMAKVTKQLGFDMTQEEFQKYLRTSPEFYFESKEILLNSYKDIVENVIKPKLPNIFKSVPKMELSIRGMPPSMEGGPLAYYYAGTPDGSRPGVFYVNLGDMKSSPKYEMISLALHEGLPGHHFQHSHILELPAVPDFRQFLEDRKYSDAPSRFPLYTAYLEGWGLYSEYLGYEMGLYEDLYSLYGHLSEEIFRACRLVVDTGIHALGWSRQQAIDYMVQNTASSLSNIEREIDRYITWPGQACAYKIGELKIRELRQMAKKELGEKFDLKEFHEIVLNNQGPLQFVARQIKGYIAKVQS